MGLKMKDQLEEILRLFNCPYLSIYRSISISIYPSVFLSIRLSSRLPAYPSIHLSAYKNPSI